MSEPISTAEQAYINRAIDAYMVYLAENDSVFRSFSQRLWRAPGYAVSPASFARCIAASFGQIMEGDEDPAVIEVAKLFYSFTRAYGFPYCVVSKSLLDTLLHTDLPDSFSLEEMMLGLPSMTFLLPRGQVFRGNEESGQTEVNILTVIDHQDAWVNVVSRALGYDVEEIPSSSVAKLDRLVFIGQNDTTGAMDCVRWNAADLSKVRETAAKMNTTAHFELSLKLLHFFCAKKDTCITDETFVKRTKGAKGREVWAARVLGAGYNTKFSSTLSGERGETTGIHQRLHIRRGHYKLQPFGEGRSQRRRILIDPYWAGGHNE